MNHSISATLSRHVVTMSSRDIADLVEKNHGHVKRDIETMLSELNKDVSSFGRIYIDSMNREQTEYHLDKELTETLVTGYSIALRHKVIVRLNELESRSAVTLPDFNNPSAAARAWADQVDAVQAANEQLAIAAPKAAFVDQYVEASGSMSFRQVAKLLKANERQLRQLLLDNHIMYYLGGVLTPYQPHIDAGRFEVKTGTCEHNSHAFSQSRFTAKGVQWIAGQWAQFEMQGAA